MRREAKKPSQEIRDYVVTRPRWQVWGGLLVAGLLITAALWPREPRTYNGYVPAQEFDDVVDWEGFVSGTGRDPIDINEADMEEILAVPSIDEEIAEGIIEKRPFEKIDDLLDVRGIGKSNLSLIRQFIYIDND